MAVKRIQTSCGPIAYRRVGHGPTVLVLTGGHCTLQTDLSHDRLAMEGFSVLTPARPGYDTTPVWVGRSAQAAATALAALLDALTIATVAVIGISAGGPTALAFAQQFPQRTTAVILESAVTLPWDHRIQAQARRVFGRGERLTWGLVRFGVRWFPRVMLPLMLRELTTLPVRAVVRTLTTADRQFVLTMLQSMQSGRGFLLDLTHEVDHLSTIQAPLLAMYSPYDKSVPPIHASHVAHEVAQCDLAAVPAPTHLIWMGPTADAVWQRRLTFLSTHHPSSGFHEHERPVCARWP